jgi:hypothetical protein
MRIKLRILAALFLSLPLQVEARTTRPQVDASILTTGTIDSTLLPASGTWTTGMSITTTGTVQGGNFIGSGAGLTGISADSVDPSHEITGVVSEVGGISKGQAVFIFGESGGFPAVSLADNTVTTRARVDGIAVESKTNGEQIRIAIGGRVSVLDLSPHSAGDRLYVGASGSLSGTIPSTGQIITPGAVGTTDSSTGQFFFSDDPGINIRATIGENVTLRMGDQVGQTKITFEEYGASEVGYITSTGTVDIYGNARIRGNATIDGYAYGKVAPVWTTLTSETTVTHGDWVILDTSGGAFDLLLDDSPVANATINILNANFGDDPTIDPQGLLINGSSTPITLIRTDTFGLVYIGGPTGWAIRF